MSRDHSPVLSELAAALKEDPHSFAFFQAVRVLERLYEDRAEVGGYGDPAGEVVRFGVKPSLAFPASEIEELEIGDDLPVNMAVNFMGLTGPLGVLPFRYTMEVAERLEAKDSALKDFLDIFHHRMISLFYRAWQKSRFEVVYEKTAQQDRREATSRKESRRDRLTDHLLDLIGIGLLSHQGRLAIADEALLFYTGLLTPQQRTAATLQQLLQDYFGVPVEIEQFVGGWYRLSDATQCSLGDDAPHSGQVGLGAVVGDEVWDQQARVRIKLGPLTREQYGQFLPSGSAYEALRDVTRFFSGDELDFEVQLLLSRDEVPACVIGADEETAVPLSWCSWIRTAPFARDADEVSFTL